MGYIDTRTPRPIKSQPAVIFLASQPINSNICTPTRCNRKIPKNIRTSCTFEKTNYRDEQSFCWNSTAQTQYPSSFLHGFVGSLAQVGKCIEVSALMSSGQSHGMMRRCGDTSHKARDLKFLHRWSCTIAKDVALD